MKYDYKNSTVDQDRQAAQEVWDRVEKTRQDSKPSAQERAGDDGHRDKAIRKMQKHYRAHVDRRTAEGRNLTSSKRFDDGLQQRLLKKAGKDQMDGKNDTASRWKRSVIYAGQLTQANGNNANDMIQSDPTEEQEMDALARNDKERKQIREERHVAKRMEPQYWLEIVDHKHRYGSNLKYYHQKWNDTDTNENFFHWLDEGGGKDLELDECPRSRLDKERITYLTAEQRESYRVVVNDEGLLVWAKDGSPLDTSKYHEDLGAEKGGVVPISEERFKEIQAADKEKIKKAKEEEGTSASSSDFGSSSSSSDDEVADEIRAGSKAYGDKGGTAGQGKGIRQLKKRVRYYASPAHVTDRLLRKTINKNTWLYVSDLTNGLFVSIKKTGSFQHSSFLYGARVTSAGLIKASDGKLTSLSPLSGHYRAGTMHFKAFVRGLEEQGVDMGSVSISKSVMTIRGIEKYGKFTKSKKAVTGKIKSVLTGSKTPEEEKAEEDEKEREKIRAHEAEYRSPRGYGLGEGKKREKETRRRNGTNAESDDEDTILPGEGKQVEDMDEEERMDRGIALLVKAFDRGLRKDVEHEEQQYPKVNAAT
ncbi:uncharacterized protein JCM15063_000153 [Sporobolomyces koalae]|uniref:uncharacterized protein n=1 Tax=Sporobolomyces koalae TaxID=500713 RepID=UPI003179267D